jgi:hypothetical protein
MKETSSLQFIYTCSPDEDLWVETCTVFIQGDQKVSVHVMITIQKVTSNVQSVPRQSPDIQFNLTAWQPTARARGTLSSH